jgi:integrase
MATTPNITTGSGKPVKRGDYWTLTYRIDGREVKHRSKSRADVLAKQAARLAAVKAEAKLAETLTLAQAYDRWMQVRGARRRDATQRMYATSYGQLAAFVGADTPLAAVKRVDLEAWEASLADDGMKLSTISARRKALRPMFRWAVGSDLLTVNPYDGLALPHVEDEAEQAEPFLDLGDAQRLTKYLRANPGDAHTACLLMLHGGLRIGEALGLQWSNVDIERGTLAVRTQVAGRGITDKLKTRSSRRDITLSPQLAGALAAQRLVDADATLVCSSRATERRRLHEPLAHRGVGYALEVACERAGVRRIHPHGLRHTAGSLVYEATHNLTQVARFLGHADLVLVQRLYVHGVTEADAGAAIGSLFGDM